MQRRRTAHRPPLGLLPGADEPVRDLTDRAAQARGQGRMDAREQPARPEARPRLLPRPQAGADAMTAVKLSERETAALLALADLGAPATGTDLAAKMLANGRETA